MIVRIVDRGDSRLWLVFGLLVGLGNLDKVGHFGIANLFVKRGLGGRGVEHDGLVIDAVVPPACACGGTLVAATRQEQGLTCCKIHLVHACADCGQRHEVRFCRPRLASGPVSATAPESGLDPRPVRHRRI